jgi:hypothetical protein
VLALVLSFGAVQLTRARIHGAFKLVGFLLMFGVMLLGMGFITAVTLSHGYAVNTAALATAQTDFDRVSVPDALSPEVGLKLKDALLLEALGKTAYAPKASCDMNLAAVRILWEMHLPASVLQPVLDSDLLAVSATLCRLHVVASEPPPGEKLRHKKAILGVVVDAGVAYFHLLEPFVMTPEATIAYSSRGAPVAKR